MRDKFFVLQPRKCIRCGVEKEMQVRQLYCWGCGAIVKKEKAKIAYLKNKFNLDGR